MTLGGAAALAGLYLVCVAIGAMAGLYLDRHGVFDDVMAPRVADAGAPASQPTASEEVSVAIAPPRPEAPAATAPRSFPYTPRSEGPSEGWEDLLAQLEQDPGPAKPAAAAPAEAPTVEATDPAPAGLGLETNSSESPPVATPSGNPPEAELLAALPSLPAPEPHDALPAPALAVPDLPVPDLPVPDLGNALPTPGLGDTLPAPDLGGTLPPWQRYAVKVAEASGRPMLAVVIDDVGLNRPGARRAFKLPGPLTMALMSYAEHLPALAEQAKAAGHELLVHLPMEPDDLGNDPGPQALLLELPPDEVARRVAWALDRFEGYVGINNHMGSRFTADGEAMAPVIAALRARGLLFLDSRTAPTSKGAMLAERAGVPFAERDIFIDNQFEDLASIRRQLDAAERIARSRGFAVAIGHPHATTLAVLERWLPEAQKRGIQLVPISAIVRLRLDLALEPVAKAG